MNEAHQKEVFFLEKDLKFFMLFLLRFSQFQKRYYQITGMKQVIN